MEVTEEVVYMLKRFNFGLCLGISLMEKGSMLFILNKDSYTLEEDAHHHTVNISLPAGIENVQPLTVISFSSRDEAGARKRLVTGTMR